jgi:mannose-1-phosphate guanylyltransferase
MLGRSLLDRLIEHLALGGIAGICVCTSRPISLEHLLGPRSLPAELRVVQDALPRGPAGCLRDAQAFIGAGTFLVASAASHLSDDPRTLLQRHRRQGNLMTVFSLPGTDVPSGVYVCEPEILDAVPAAGFFDLKQQLIPRLLGQGCRIGVLPLQGTAGEVVDEPSYLALHRRLLCGGPPARWAYRGDDEREGRSRAGISTSARVAGSARLVGPVLVGPGAGVDHGARVVGPSSIGANASVEADAVVAECAVWAGERIPAGCRVAGVIVGRPGPRRPTPEPRRAVRRGRVGETETLAHV